MGSEFISNSFKLGSVQDYVKVIMQYVGIIHLNQEQVIAARRFQTTILSLLIKNDHLEVSDAIKNHHEVQVSVGVVYLLLPLVSGKVDWCSIKFSASPVYEDTNKDTRHCQSCKDVDLLQTKDGPLCRCMLQNSVVYDPRNSIFYAVTGSIENQRLFAVIRLFTVRNFLHKCDKSRKEPSDSDCLQLPPGRCRLVMSKVSANTLRSFSFIPSIMCRIQCMLLSVRLKVQLGPRMQQINIPALKGYIQGEEFNPKNWVIPGLGYDACGNSKSFSLRANNMYSLKKISVKNDRIADTVEALIGAYLSAAGEPAAFLFIKSLGMDIKFHTEMPDERKITTKPEEFIDVTSLQTLLGYVFNDPALLMEALTHGSYRIAGTTACYERLEFLGDAVLDHIFTKYYYNQYAECTPALLTDLRSASTNNNCYRHAAVKAGLHKHILHSLSEQMIYDLENSGRSFSGPSHGWEPGIGLPEDLADLIESIAGAIYLDSKHDKEKVWRSMRGLLDPLATLETVGPDPVSELKELCEERHYCLPSYTRKDGVTTVVAEVPAKGTSRTATGTCSNMRMAKKLAAKDLLKDLKAAVP